MKKITDLKRIERNFHKGDWVYLKLQPYRQISLSLPDGSAIHPVFHVSQLKNHISRGQNISPRLPITSSEGQLKFFP
jgi:hypothetical protein